MVSKVNRRKESNGRANKVNRRLENFTKERAFRAKQPSEELQLIDKIYEYAPYFEDMLFLSDSGENATTKLIKVLEGNDDGIPKDIYSTAFEYSFFSYRVRKLRRKNCGGQFNKSKYTLTISPEYINEPKVILHEMIHLHEFYLSLFPMYYRDAILWCLYTDLRNKISNLDAMIDGSSHILLSRKITAVGGSHDMVFLLKSLDLDLKMGYSPGCVFGYGMEGVLN